MRTSRSPTTVMTANGEVQTREEATETVKELDLFVTVMLLQETPAIPSLGRLCEDRGLSYHWTSGQKPHHTKNGKRIDCSTSNYVPFVVTGLSASSSTTTTPTSSSSSSQDSVFDVADKRNIQYPKELEVRVRSFGETRCIDQKNEGREEVLINNMNCPIGCKSSARIWSMNVVLQSHGETQSKEVKTLPSLHMNYPWSREQKWNRVRVSTVNIRTVRRIPIVISA